MSQQVRGGPNDKENADANIRTSTPPTRENTSAPAPVDGAPVAEIVTVHAAPAIENVNNAITATNSPTSSSTTTWTTSNFATVTPGSAIFVSTLFKSARFDVAKRKSKCHGDDCRAPITKGCIRIQHQVSVNRPQNKSSQRQLQHYHVPCWLQKKTITARADFDRYANFSTFPLEIRQELLQATSQSSKDIRSAATEAAASRPTLRIRMSPPPAPRMPPKRCLGTTENGDRCLIHSDMAFTSSSNLPMPEGQYVAAYLLREGYYTCGHHLHQWIPKEQMDAEDARIRDELVASTEVYNREMKAYNKAQVNKKAASSKMENTQAATL
jgi:hypothetical protein